MGIKTALIIPALAYHEPMNDRTVHNRLLELREALTAGEVARREMGRTVDLDQTRTEKTGSD